MGEIYPPHAKCTRTRGRPFWGGYVCSRGCLSNLRMLMEDAIFNTKYHLLSLQEVIWKEFWMQFLWSVAFWGRANWRRQVHVRERWLCPWAPIIHTKFNSCIRKTLEIQRSFWKIFVSTTVGLLLPRYSLMLGPSFKVNYFVSNERSALPFW